MKTLSIGLLVAAAIGTGSLTICGAAAADPLGGKEPWNFTPQNRAAIAIAIKNVEDGNGAGGVGGGGTTVLCGGTSGAQGDGSTGSGASATANSSCVIVNNSDGAIVSVGQDSYGDQSAEADTESSSSTSNNTLQSQSNGPTGSIDEVAAILGGRGR